MPKNVKPLRRPIVRFVEIEGVEFRVELRPDATIVMSAKRHQLRYKRHLAGVFPDLARKHGLVVESGLRVFHLAEPPVRTFGPEDAGGSVIFASGVQQVFEFERRHRE
jgi:hypothetical protein